MKTIPMTLLTLALAVCLLLAGCSSATYISTLTATEVSSAVTSALPSIAGLRTADADYVSASRFGEDGRRDLLDKCKDYVILLAANTATSADQIGVFRVAKESDVSAVADIVRSYVSTEAPRLRQQYASYAPDQCPKLDAAAVKVCGTYILYTFLSEADTTTAQDAFETALKAD